jgi:hypothetical protein
LLDPFEDDLFFLFIFTTDGKKTVLNNGLLGRPFTPALPQRRRLFSDIGIVLY